MTPGALRLVGDSMRSSRVGSGRRQASSRPHQQLPKQSKIAGTQSPKQQNLITFPAEQSRKGCPASSGGNSAKGSCRMFLEHVSLAFFPHRSAHWLKRNGHAPAPPGCCVRVRGRRGGFVYCINGYIGRRLACEHDTKDKTGDDAQDTTNNDQELMMCSFVARQCFPGF